MLPKIQDYILKNVPHHPSDIVAITAKHFQITPQAIHKHITHLIKTGRLTKQGRTRSALYEATQLPDRPQTARIPVASFQSSLLDADEHVVWRQTFAPTLTPSTSSIQPGLYEVFAEIFKNAKDHSGGTRVQATLYEEGDSLLIEMCDDGVGIFRKIKQAAALTELREAVFLLFKGKYTSDPSRTGEGIFFLSHAADALNLSANGFAYTASRGDWRVRRVRYHQGTIASVRIRL